MLSIRRVLHRFQPAWFRARMLPILQKASQYGTSGWKACVVSPSRPHRFFRLLAGVTGAAMYDWDAERVFERDLEKMFPEFDDTKALLDGTQACEEFRRTKIVDYNKPWSVHCREDPSLPTRGWETVMETPNTVIWKRPYKGREDLFEYRTDMILMFSTPIFTKHAQVFGKFTDISAGAWFHVNADDVFRTIWDKTVVDLKEVDHDATTNTRILYWRTKIPYLQDRDYVLKKNYALDEHRRKAIVYLHDTVHPFTPETDKAVRVVRYKSVLIVTPDHSFDENGMEFTMYVVDDQGANLPKFFVDAVAAEGFLSYVNKMHDEAAAFQRKKTHEELSAQSIVEYYGLHQPGEHVARRKRQHERHFSHDHPHHHDHHRHQLKEPTESVTFSESLENAKKLRDEWEQCDAEGKVWIFITDGDGQGGNGCVHDNGHPNDD